MVTAADMSGAVAASSPGGASCFDEARGGSRAEALRLDAAIHEVRRATVSLSDPPRGLTPHTHL